MNRPTVLIAAADVALRAEMARLLRSAGYIPELAEGAKRAREIVARAKVDLAIVAAMQLGPTGIGIARELGDAAGRLLVVAETAQAERLDRFFPGAVVSLAPPWEDELLGRIAGAIARQTAASQAPPALQLCFGGCRLDVEGRVLVDAGGREVARTDHEYRLLAEFALNPGRVRSREQLRNAVGGEEVEAFDRSIDMQVSRLRRKIEPDPRHPRFIVTVPGAGYKFAAAVERVAALPPATRPTPATEPAIPPPERRRLTVLSCLIDGLAAFARTGDTDAVQETTTALRRVCTDVIGRFGGQVDERVRGDALLAHFGWPDAHEDDAERAIRAGLELEQALPSAAGELTSTLHPRIGVATGAVVVEALGIVGQAPRRADRLAAAAPPCSILIDAETRQCSGGIFECDETDPVRLEDAANPVAAWRVIAENLRLGRFEALRGERLTPLVDREDEIAMLRQRWERACGGAGQAVVLIGEPGIGKSRLAFELQRLAAEREHTRLLFSGSPYHTNSALFPVGNYLAQAAGFARDDGGEQRLAQLRALVAKTGVDADEALPFLASLLSLPPGEPAFAQLTPAQRKEQTFAVLLRISERLAARQPVLMVFEDAQWFDDLSLDLLAREIERAPRLPMLLLITARPEFAPPWPDHAHVMRQSLTRLARPDAAMLVEHVAGGPSLPMTAVRRIVARADSVPLFLEELTKMTLEDPAYPAAERGSRRRVPDALQGLLLARIDRLDRADKAVAQLAAVIGRNFSYELLGMLESDSAGRLDAALERLTKAGIVFRQGVPPDATYTFKHALLRDAAYGILSRRRQRALHANVAQALEQRFPDIVEAQPELLAHHHAEAGTDEAAASYRLKAGQKALRVSAATAAIAQLKDGLHLVRALPASAARDLLTLRLHASLGAALNLANGYASPAAGDSFAAAAGLVEAAKDPAEGMQVLWGSWVHLHVRGRTDEAVAMSHRIRAMAERYGDPHSRYIANAIAGSASFYSGRPAESAELFERVIAAAPEREPLDLYPVSHRIVSTVGAALASWILGRGDEAAALIARAEREARALRHDFSIAFVLAWGATVHLLGGDLDRAAAWLEEGIGIASRQGFSYIVGLGGMVRGQVIAARGEPATGIETLQRGLEAFEATGASITTGYFRVLLASMLLEGGQIDEALAAVGAAEAQMQRWGERWHEPELYRVRADILAGAAADSAEVERTYRRAVATARQQGAAGWEARAQAGLSRWLEHAGGALHSVHQAGSSSPQS